MMGNMVVIRFTFLWYGQLASLQMVSQMDDPSLFRRVFVQQNETQMGFVDFNAFLPKTVSYYFVFMYFICYYSIFVLVDCEDFMNQSFYRLTQEMIAIQQNHITDR